MFDRSSKGCTAYSCIPFLLASELFRAALDTLKRVPKSGFRFFGIGRMLGRLMALRNDARKILIVEQTKLFHHGLVISKAQEINPLPAGSEIDAGDSVMLSKDSMLNARQFYTSPAVPKCNPLPVVFWLTGISGSGKTSIATCFEELCRAQGWPVVVLDGDVVRSRLNADLGFSDQDRAENVRRIAEVAALMADAGLLVIVSCISPMKSFRESARSIVGDQRFIEVYVDTPLDVAQARDPKGLYQRVRAGEILSFTGIHARYEVPLKPQIRIDTTVTDIDIAAQILRTYYINNLRHPAQGTSPGRSSST